MAEQEEISDPRGESFIDTTAEKVSAAGDSSSFEPEEKTTQLPPVAVETKERSFSFFGREKPIHKAFGGGKPADIFLWRDKKISTGALVGATAVWILFELLDYHLLALLSHILIFALGLLFLWSNASVFINKRTPHIPEVRLPEEPFLEVASALRTTINCALSELREIASSRDLKKFLIVVAGLWILAIVGSFCNFLTLAYISFVSLLTVPVLYEKYDDKIDRFVEKATIEIKHQYAVFDAKVLSKIPRVPLERKKD